VTGPSEAQRAQAGEITGKEVSPNPWRFSVAPMMDWNGHRKKAKLIKPQTGGSLSVL
jgi:hypothetical protein